MIIAQLAQVLTHIRNNTVSVEVYATPPIALVSDATAARQLKAPMSFSL